MTSPNKIILVALALAGASCVAIFAMQSRAQSGSGETVASPADAAVDDGMPGASGGSPGDRGNEGSPGNAGSVSGTGGSSDSVAPGVRDGVPGVAEGSSGGASQGYAGSAGSSSDGNSGSGSTGGSDITSGSDSTVSSGDTVSVNATGNHEWTQEEMLLARPMPMSQEERDFVFAHKAPETIKAWTAEEFDQFVSNPIGAQQIFAEGQRWIDIRKMLLAQTKVGKQFLFGNKKSSKADAILAVTPTDEVFIKELSDLKKENRPEIFQKMQQCRGDISTLCEQMDKLKAIAKKQNKLALMEQACSNAQP